jgi:hypothetical chaperone protein
LPKAIGLDFGTTNSALAVANPDRSVTLAEFSASSTFRSILYFDEDEGWSPSKFRVTAGPDAIQSYLNARAPGRLIQSTKSYLASRLFGKTQILNETFTLEDLIGILLRQLRRSAERQFGDLGTTLVAGRPVHFSGARDIADDEFAVDRLRAAFQSAGFEDVRFLAEPVAAAYKYQQRLDHDELVLIADFGGGTSDFSLVHLKANQTPGDLNRQVIGNSGVGIAGDTFDSKLVRMLVAPMLGLGSEYKSHFGKVLPVPNWIYEHLERWHYLSFLKTRKNLELLRQIRHQALEPAKIEALMVLVDHDLGYHLYRSIESVKCTLSEVPETLLCFSEPSVNIEIPVNRNRFESWIEPEVQRIVNCMDRLLDNCNVDAREVDAIFMTGGSSFVPAIRGIFQRKFGDRPIRAGEEFTSVAEGLALHALELLD